MSINELLEQALELKAIERSKLIDELLKSLDKPDQEVDKVWENEANKRLESYRKGEVEILSEEEFFNYKYEN